MTGFERPITTLSTRTTGRRSKAVTKAAHCGDFEECLLLEDELLLLPGTRPPLERSFRSSLSTFLMGRLEQNTDTAVAETT